MPTTNDVDDENDEEDENDIFLDELFSASKREFKFIQLSHNIKEETAGCNVQSIQSDTV